MRLSGGVAGVCGVWDGVWFAVQQFFICIYLFMYLSTIYSNTTAEPSRGCMLEETTADTHVDDSEMEDHSSDSHEDIILHRLVASDSEDSSLDSASDDDIDADLQLPALKVHTTAPRSTSVDSNELVKRSNMGNLFDSKINQHIERLAIATDTNKPASASASACGNTPSQEAKSITESMDSQLLPWRQSLQPQVFQLLANGKLFPHGPDWYFITGSPGRIDTHKKKLGEELLKLGVPSTYLSPDFILIDKHLNNFDTINEMYPIDYILDTFNGSLNEDSDTQATSWFILLILDLNIYNSIECDLDWCEETFKKLHLVDNISFITHFNHLVQLDKHKFFITSRLIRQLPFLRDDILKFWFKNDLNILINQFNELLDKNEFYQLLYFLLIILGSPILTNTPRDSVNTLKQTDSVIQYFKDCILDVSNGQSDDVELTIIVGLINMFAKL